MSLYIPLLLFSLLIFSGCSKYAKTYDLMLLDSNLPQFVVSNQDKRIILANSTNSIIFDKNNKNSTPYLDYLYEKCLMASEVESLLPRFHITKENKIYFYCKLTRQIIIFNEDTKPEEYVRLSISNIPTLTELKFVETNSNKLNILGLTGNDFALYRNCQSFMIEIDLATNFITTATEIRGENQECIVDFLKISDNEEIKLGINHEIDQSEWVVYKNEIKLRSFLLSYDKSTKFITKISFINEKNQIILGFPSMIYILNLNNYENLIRINIKSAPIARNFYTQNFFVVDDKYIICYDFQNHYAQVYQIFKESFEIMSKVEIFINKNLKEGITSRFIPYKYRKFLVSAVESKTLSFIDFTDLANPKITSLPSFDTVKTFKLIDSDFFIAELLQNEKAIIFAKNLELIQSKDQLQNVKVVQDQFSKNIIWKIGYMFHDIRNCYIDASDHLGTVYVHHPLPEYYCNISKSYDFYIKGNPLNLWDFKLMSIETSFPGTIKYYFNTWTEYTISKNPLFYELIYTSFSYLMKNISIRFDFEKKILYYYGVNKLLNNYEYAFFIECTLGEEFSCSNNFNHLESANQIDLYDLNENGLALVAYKESLNQSIIEIVEIGNPNTINEINFNGKIDKLVAFSDLDSNNLNWIVKADNKIFKSVFDQEIEFDLLKDVQCSETSSQESELVDANVNFIVLKCKHAASVRYDLFEQV